MARAASGCEGGEGVELVGGNPIVYHNVQESLQHTTVSNACYNRHDWGRSFLLSPAVDYMASWQLVSNSMSSVSYLLQVRTNELVTWSR